jgi:hypothetical protein
MATYSILRDASSGSPEAYQLDHPVPPVCLQQHSIALQILINQINHLKL